MAETYSCTFANCNNVFTRAYELKKHMATHENPSSVFHCSECDFITLQKKSLAIHFAKHTGEKTHHCPDMISSGPSARDMQCEYRTNDPAALSRHRKKIHGYVPPLNRGRPTRTAHGNTQQRADDKVTRRPQRTRRPGPASRRNLSRLLPMTNNVDGGTPDIAEVPLGRDRMDVDSYYGFDCEGLVDSEEEMGLDTLCDPSLRSQWMARYEEGYSTFNMTELKYHPEPVRAPPPLPFTRVDVQTGREGCLCPEWMVEAAIWDRSALQPPRECYVLDA